MNAQHSEVFKMAYYDLLACLVPPQCRRKVAMNLLFSAKIAFENTVTKPNQLTDLLIKRLLNSNKTSPDRRS